MLCIWFSNSAFWNSLRYSGRKNGTRPGHHAGAEENVIWDEGAAPPAGSLFCVPVLCVSHRSLLKERKKHTKTKNLKWSKWLVKSLKEHRSITASNNNKQSKNWWCCLEQMFFGKPLVAENVERFLVVLKTVVEKWKSSAADRSGWFQMIFKAKDLFGDKASNREPEAIKCYLYSSASQPCQTHRESFF